MKTTTIAFYFALENSLGLPEGYSIRKGHPEFLTTDDRGVELQVTSLTFRFFERKTPESAFHTSSVAFDVAAEMSGIELVEDRSVNQALFEKEITVAEVCAEVIGMDEAVEHANNYDGALDATSFVVTPVFDYALHELRKSLRAYQFVFDEVTKLPTLENLPPVVPMLFSNSVTELHNGSFDSGLSIFLTPPNGAHQPTLDKSEDEVTERWNSGLMLFENNGPFAPWAELRQEAIYNLHVEGQARAGIIALASACELLLDDLLISFLWERRVEPKNVADEYFRYSRNGRREETSVVYRVKNNYEEFLGGSWRFEKNNPLWSWNKFIASIRNDVIHAGYSPTLQDTKRALQSEAELRHFIADNLYQSREDNLITMRIFLGDEGLLARGEPSLPIQSLESLNTNQTRFNRYRRYVSEARKPRDQRAKPQKSSSDFVIVFRSSERFDSFLVDPGADKAAKIDYDRQVPRDMKQVVSEVLKKNPRLMAPKCLGQSISLAEINAEEIHGTISNWEPAFKLIPGHEIFPVVTPAQ